MTSFYNLEFFLVISVIYINKPWILTEILPRLAQLLHTCIIQAIFKFYVKDLQDMLFVLEGTVIQIEILDVDLLHLIENSTQLQYLVAMF